jgi:ABC-type sugar transport system ATPase subunit
MALAARVTVLRDGEVAMTARMGETNRASLIRAMTGHEVSETHSARSSLAMGQSICRLAIAAAGRLSDLHFDLHQGEVLGVAGLEASGQSELLHLFLGDRGAMHGAAEVLGAPLPRSPAAAWERGIAFVPRERRKDGLMLGRSITANMVLPHLFRLSRRGILRAAGERAAAQRLADRLGLRFRHLSEPVRRLSGGNQQKVVLARATLMRPRLLLLDEPTRGVDVGARADIYAEIRNLAAQGTGVLLASTDLPELIGLSDRILILREGRQVGLVDARALDPASLLSLVYGDHHYAGAA